MDINITAWCGWRHVVWEKIDKSTKLASREKGSITHRRLHTKDCVI